MSPNFTYYSGCSDPKLEAELEALHRKLLEDAKTKAVHFGRQNRPALKGDHIIHYTGDSDAGYQAMVARIWQQLQPEMAEPEAKMLTGQAERKQNELRQKKQDTETELLNLELDMKQRGESIDDITRLKPKRDTGDLIPVGIAVAEFALNVFSFQLLGDNMLVSVIISAGVSAALFFLAKHLAKFLKEEGTESRKKAMVAAGATALALGVFYLIAYLRSVHLQEDSGITIHPALLVLLNALFFAVTVWYYYRNTQSPEEGREYERKSRLKETIEGLKKQIKECEAEEKKIKQETDDALTLLLHKPGYAKWLCERVNKWSAETTEVFKSVNLMHRPDRSVPDCFANTAEEKKFF